GRERKDHNAYSQCRLTRPETRTVHWRLLIGIATEDITGPHRFPWNCQTRNFVISWAWFGAEKVRTHAKVVGERRSLLAQGTNVLKASRTSAIRLSHTQFSPSFCNFPYRLRCHED